MANRASHLPTYRERVGLEAIQAGRPMPEGVGPSTLAGLIRKGWVEQADIKYRLTVAGLDALRRKFPTRQAEQSI